jgi:hypothetical protein
VWLPASTCRGTTCIRPRPFPSQFLPVHNLPLVISSTQYGLSYEIFSTGKVDPVYYRKANNGSRSTPPLILNLDTRWSSVMNLTPLPVYVVHLGKNRGTHSVGRWGGIRVVLDVLGKGNICDKWSVSCCKLLNIKVLNNKYLESSNIIILKATGRWTFIIIKRLVLHLYQYLTFYRISKKETIVRNWQLLTWSRNFIFYGTPDYITVFVRDGK